MRQTSRVMGIALAGVLAAGISLAGCANKAEEKKGDETTQTEKAEADSQDAEGTEGEEEVINDATLWMGVTTGAEAMKGANLTGDFIVPEKVVAHGMEFTERGFSYTDGVAQAQYDQPAAIVQIRKGMGPGGTVKEDDGTGFTGESFLAEWKLDINGTEVTCHGDAQGEALFVQWYNKVDPAADGESDAYSIRAMGLGGEEIPMTDVEVAEIVKAVH